MDKLEIEYININDIKTYENNAKLHPAEQIEQIKKSIQEFGFNDPIAIDKDNTIIEEERALDSVADDFDFAAAMPGFR